MNYDSTELTTYTIDSELGWCRVEFYPSIDHAIIYAELSWIETRQKGTGCQIMNEVLRCLSAISIRESKEVRLFVEPTTQSAHRFFNKYVQLQNPFIQSFYWSESPIYTSTWGYCITVHSKERQVYAEA